MTLPVARVASRAQCGLNAPLVQVEVHLGCGLPMFSLVGLPAKAVKESKERVRAALVNSRFEFPAGRITVNLAPADLPKEGGRFDLPIALGILLASGQVRLRADEAVHTLARCEFYGELGLAGELRPVKGLLLAAAHALRDGHELIVPEGNVSEARIAARRGVHGAGHLLEVCGYIDGTGCRGGSDARLDGRSDGRIPGPCTTTQAEIPDLRDVRGQLGAKRALAIAAAGGHSLLMLGPPGSGKSLLAQRLPGLLPPLTEAEALEVAMIASVSTAGFDQRRFGCRPFRTPHHTASVCALVGGGSKGRPGEVSLAHRGVLFLDELPEFDSRALEALREPLENGSIAVARVALRVEYPAEFQLLAAMNPCPCGYRGDPEGACECTPGQVAQYRARLSGPLLDRVDLRIEVPALQARELAATAPAGDSSAGIAARVHAAQERQRARAGKLNARLTLHELGTHCRPDEAGERLLWESQARLGLSARGYHRTLRVARTIADLEAGGTIRATHVAEAIQLRRALD